MSNRKVKTFISVLLLAVGLGGCSQNNGTVNQPPETKEEYEEQREELEAENDYRTSVTLSETEKKADAALTEMKEAYILSCKGEVPYNMPVLKDKNIWESDLYQFCKDLPKGSDLHIHGLAILPMDELLDHVSSRPELMIVTDGEAKYKLVCHENAEEAAKNEMPLKEAFDKGVLDRDEVIRNWSLHGLKEDMDVWEWFERLFDAHTALGATNDLVEDYYTKAFRYCCEHNVMHLESRELFFGSHEDAKARAEAIRSAYYKVRDEYPDFVCSIVGAGLKRTSLDPALTDTLIDNALYVYENVKDEYTPGEVHDFLVGIDLVNEEDDSRPLEYYAEMLNKIRADYPDLILPLHAGESLYASSDNVIDAYLLQAERIGHGINLYRYPGILEDLKNAGTCVEVCPISNQILGYVKDLRSHPATEYLKRGLPIVLASDDPAYEEHTELVDDFFAAIVCWDLNLDEVKQLCMNSIQYSGLDDVQKKRLQESWEKEWDRFVSAF